jgi:O-antigen/teichoic acid export membrane protein
MVVAFAYVLSFVIRLGSNVILARFLLPESFGVMLLVSAISTVLSLVSDVGLAPSIYRNAKAEDANFRGTVWSIQILQGVFLAFALVCVAVFLHTLQLHNLVAKNTAFGDQALPGILVLIALSNVVSGFRSLNVVFAQKVMLQRLIARNELIVQAVGALVTCLLAWFTRNVWALAWGGFFTQLLSVAVSYQAYPGVRDRPAWNMQIIKQEWPFAKWILISSAIGVFGAQADKFTLASMLSATFLGLFSLAFGLVSAIENGVSKLITTIGLPILTEIVSNNQNDLKARYARFAMKIECVCFGLIGAIAVCGNSIVGFLYPSNFAEAGLFVSVLSLVILSARASLTTQFCLAIGRSQVQAVFSFSKLVFSITATVVGFWMFGAVGAIVGVGIQFILIFVTALVIEYRLGIALEMRRIMGALVCLILGCAVGYSISLLLNLAR